ncbi:uncharacterized protein N7459_001296 [Penicillium hispanicum]|uniref:uncharacterized protein n=1 Tax=Penicillium hispanicum TaxID=1080232 RepID=UPI0025406F31|nr:uncharacterized protein N7459_001296 [Penicillium hispanicum]KAJ5595088.1 hypothetical protein N7459_001296 [Penicillium hispanicum]
MQLTPSNSGTQHPAIVISGSDNAHLCWGMPGPVCRGDGSQPIPLASSDLSSCGLLPAENRRFAGQALSPLEQLLIGLAALTDASIPRAIHGVRFRSDGPWPLTEYPLPRGVYEVARLAEDSPPRISEEQMPCDTPSSQI